MKDNKRYSSEGADAAHRLRHVISEGDGRRTGVIGHLITEYGLSWKEAVVVVDRVAKVPRFRSRQRSRAGRGTLYRQSWKF